MGSLGGPSVSSADYASTSDRYSSMKFDPIDKVVDALDS